MTKELKFFSEEIAEDILEIKELFEKELPISSRKMLNFYTLECNSMRLQNTLASWTHGYDKASITIEISCSKNSKDETAFDVVVTSFLYQGTYVEPRFENKCTTIESEVPTILDILRECVSQNTANPVMKVD